MFPGCRCKKNRLLSGWFRSNHFTCWNSRSTKNGWCTTRGSCSSIPNDTTRRRRRLWTPTVPRSFVFPPWHLYVGAYAPWSVTASLCSSSSVDNGAKRLLWTIGVEASVAQSGFPRVDGWSADLAVANDCSIVGNYESDGGPCWGWWHMTCDCGCCRGCWDDCTATGKIRLCTACRSRDKMANVAR